MSDKKTALLIIDTQRAFFEAPKPLYQVETLIANIKALIAKARTAQIRVIYFEANADGDYEWMNSTPLHDTHPAIAPTPADLVIQKWSMDIFEGTPLESTLKTGGIDKIIITGCQTEFCINTSCRGAASRGYDVTLVSDAHGTFDSDTLTAGQIIENYSNDLSALVSVKPAREIVF